jgi:hypothetical protein
VTEKKKPVRRAHYVRWHNMYCRCYKPSNPAFKYYGGRGIYICDEWLDFDTFQAWCLATFEPGKSIDRIDNDGPYSPDNCRWATHEEQQKNSRKTQAMSDAMQSALRERNRLKLLKFGDPSTRTEKFCSNCKVLKPTSDFYKSKKSACGLGGECKVCFNIRTKERRLVVLEIETARLANESLVSKVCSICKETLHLTSFYRCKAQCKSCSRAYDRERRKRAREISTL